MTGTGSKPTHPVSGDTIYGAFAVQAREHPDRRALVEGGEGGRVFTYGELEAWSTAIAQALGSSVEGQTVGLWASRSPAAVAAIFGIWQAGGVYVPLDPKAPDARSLRLICDCGAAAILTTRADAERIGQLAGPQVEIVCIPECRAPSRASVGPGDGEETAYLMYTSGSTGEPKGVLVPHRGVVALATSRFVAARPSDVFVQLAPLTTDPSVFEITCPLLNGATLVVPPAGDLSIEEIGDEVTRHGVTVMRLVAPLFRVMVETNVEALRGLRLLISGGDRASESAVRRALDELPGCVVVNGYGPTETTIYALCHPMTRYDDAWPSVPIGVPIDGVTAHVFDDLQRAVPDGEVGELFIGGIGVAHGYLGKPELTRERFVEHPHEPGVRLYRTGDRVRRLHGGAFEFLGRTDDQIKIRGFRVELGEVESVLLEHDLVETAAVVARPPGEATRLEAFVTGPARGPAPDSAGLRTHLADRLPEHMVPRVIWVVPRLPKTDNGKVDRRMLARSGPPVLARESYVAPTNDLQRALARICGEVLAVPRVGLDDSFFDLGGHSLAAMEIVARVSRELRGRLSLATIFDTPTVRAWAADLESVSSSSVERAERAESHRAPLSYGQEGIWFEDQLDTAGRFNIARTYQVRGAFDEQAFRTALFTLAQRQDVLRTVVESDESGQLWQTVREDVTPTVECVDLSHLPVEERDARAKRLVERSVKQRFSTGLMRVLLVSLGDDRWVVHVCLHHLIADDWSLDVLWSELSALYQAETTGRAARLPPLESRYADFALAEREAGQDEEVLAQWAAALDGYQGTLDLPTDLTRPAIVSGRGARISFELDPQLAASIAVLARAHRVTGFMVFVGAIGMLVSRYAEQDDVCIGTPVARRDRPGTQDLIGYLVNMLPLRIGLDGERTFVDLLAHVRSVCVEAYSRQAVPFREVVRALDVPYDGSRSPLFQVVVAYQRRPPRALEVAGAAVTPWREAEPKTSKYDLGFDVEERDGELRFDIEYATDLFDAATITRMGEHLANLLQSIVSDPTAPTSELTMMSKAEERRVVVEWNDNDGTLPLDRCLHELVTERGRATPEKIALVGDDESLTYAELENRSERLAARLLRAGLAHEERVAVCLERSPRLTVVILAIMKAGGVYVPLDPSYPAERLAFTVGDARAKLLITTSQLQRRLFGAEMVGTSVLDIDELLASLDERRARPAHRPTPRSLAYIIYTSGSTGTPRGAAIEHRSVVNALQGHIELYAFRESDVWSQFASAGFDMAIYEQFMPLLTGATSVICSDEVKQDGREFVEFVDRHRVTALVLAPAFLRALGQPAFDTVRFVITGGEAASMEDVGYYGRTKCYLNCYGPTETTVCATTYVARDVDPRTARLSIGKALPNYRLYVLDRWGKVAPIGVPGELYIGGVGLARAYWNNDDLTREKFVAVSAVGSQRLYKTGDRVRWLPDGNLDFLGRVDDQVKLRGFRIELGEVEAVLNGHPQVAQGAVVVRRSPSDDALVAFFVGVHGASPTPEDLRAHLGKQLPSYMVPAVFVPLARMPMTEHAKVDRRSLSRLATDARPESRAAGPSMRAGDDAPASSLELKVLQLWREELGVNDCGMRDDFFALGGHSLVIVRLLARLETEVGLRLGVRAFLSDPTARGVAANVGDARAGIQFRDALVDGDEEAQLDEAMQFASPTRPASDPRAVLLTGVTGFVGAFVLRELLAQTRADIYCLIRVHAGGSSVDDARGRLRKALGDYRLDVDASDPRIVVVPGDLAQPRLGVGSQYSTLCERVDAVFHCGAHVHHLSPYRRLEPANVDGTRELLRIVSRGQPKRLHHLSSLSIFADADRDRVVSELTAIDGEQHPHGKGYAASKWVADMLIERAIGRGASARIYRLGRVAGETNSGAVNTDDMFCRLLVSCAMLGCYADDAAFATNLLPVDVVARSLLLLALSDEPGLPAYHLHHPQGTGVEAFMRVRDDASGTRTEAIPLAAWLDRAKRSVEAGHRLPIVPYFGHFEDLLRSDTARTSVKYANERTLSALVRCGLSIPPIDAALITRYWRYLEANSELSSTQGRCRHD